MKVAEERTNVHIEMIHDVTTFLLVLVWFHLEVLVGLGAVAALAVNLYGGMTWTLVSLKKQGLSSDVRTAAGAVQHCMVLLLVPWSQKLMMEFN